jgi:hypothetical protein
VVHLADEGLEIPNRTSVFSGVYHVYRVLQLGHQRVVLAAIQHSRANSAFTELMTTWVACCGVRTMKLTEFDVSPPGLVTVTLKVPAVAMSEARIAAVSCVALTNVVARALALKLTVEPQRVRRILPCRAMCAVWPRAAGSRHFPRP